VRTVLGHRDIAPWNSAVDSATTDLAPQTRQHRGCASESNDWAVCDRQHGRSVDSILRTWCSLEQEVGGLLNELRSAAALLVILFELILLRGRDDAHRVAARGTNS
jgi:hypothetical protein